MALDASSRGKDRLEEINRNLIQSHLVYLQTDESPMKLKQRQKLEGFIREYLYLVPHENKFVFQETAHILHRSAATVSDFSGYRACSAWTAISLYASNLLAQPWRTEYRTLRTYSGFYKHEIEANLVGAELMFELMGYKHTGIGVLTLEGLIDPDTVSYVSKDAIVAFVECQIMKQIWEGASQNFNISWLEILEFRENHVGTPEQAIRALNHRYWERFQQQNRMKMDYYCAQPTIIDTVPTTTVPYQIGCGYTEENPHYFLPVESSVTNRCNAYDCLPKNDRFYGTLYPDPYLLNNTPSYGIRVPIGRLVEVDTTSIPVVHHEKSRHRQTIATDRKIHDVGDYPYKAEFQNDYSQIDQRKVMKTSTSLDSATNESWDFVYRSLDSLGYYKDGKHCEDILKKKDNKDFKSKSSKTLITEHKNDYGNHWIDKKRDNKNDKIGINERDHMKNKSSNDLMNSNGINSGNVKQERSKKIHQINSVKNDQKVVELIKNISINSKDDNCKVFDGNNWDCSFCTYLNTPKNEICEMCSRSRLKGNEDRPLASGGKECPKCTLVNERDASICEACNTSLKDSPTYI